MCTREILTLQFGHYANYVGTHWWNIQELGFEYKPNTVSEINNDVLFREGFNDKGHTTFTPRVLLADLKGSLKSLPQYGDLYERLPEPSKIDVQWEHSEIREETKTKKIAFQTELENPSEPKTDYNLDEEVNVWSDFLYTKFHPRSVNVVKDYEHESEISPFNVFPLGGSLWNTEYFLDDFSDKIRNYAEECNSFQGFQILFDATDAFGGLATSCIQHLRDEYDNKSIFALPLIPSFNREFDDNQTILNDSIRVLNIGLCYNALVENASVFTPLCTGVNGWRQPGASRSFNHLVYNNDSIYHSSAILAAALDTFTLKYRLKNSSYSLSDLACDLTGYGRKLAAASLCLPFSLNEGADLIDCLDNWDGPLTQSITPNCKIGNKRMMQLISLRGVPESRLKKPIDKAGKQADMPAYKCNSVSDMLKMFLAYTYDATASDVTCISKPLRVIKPFPKIFDDRIGANGNVILGMRAKEIGVESVPVLSGLHSGSIIGESVESLHTEMRKIKFARFHQFINAGLEKDEYDECLDKLFDFREVYEDNYFI